PAVDGGRMPRRAPRRRRSRLSRPAATAGRAAATTARSPSVAGRRAPTAAPSTLAPRRCALEEPSSLEPWTEGVGDALRRTPFAERSAKCAAHVPAQSTIALGFAKDVGERLGDASRADVALEQFGKSAFAEDQVRQSDVVDVDEPCGDRERQ